jgi:hypothetical protein
MRREQISLHTLLLCAICILAFPGLIYADVYLKYKQHVDPFNVMGQEQPGKDAVRETWIAKDMIRNDEGLQTVIMRLDKKLVYFINNEQKTYAELPMDVEKMAKQAIEHDKSMSSQEKEEAKRFLKEMMKDLSKINITVKETEEKKQIGTWDCKKYIQTTTTSTGPSMTEIWATKDIDLDYGLLNRMYAASMMMMPSMRDSIDDIMREMSKIKGVTVYSSSTTSVMDTQIKSSQELLAYADRKAPEGFYEPPKGYSKHEM